MLRTTISLPVTFFILSIKDIYIIIIIIIGGSSSSSSTSRMRYYHVIYSFIECVAPAPIGDRRAEAEDNVDLPLSETDVANYIELCNTAVKTTPSIRDMVRQTSELCEEFDIDSGLRTRTSSECRIPL